MGDPVLHRDAPDGRGLTGPSSREASPAVTSATSPSGIVRGVALGAVLGVSLGLAPAGPAAARPLDDVVESGKITVFVYSDYAPYSWGEGVEAQGIDVEIAREIGDFLDVETELLIRGADENVDDDLRVNVWKGDLIHRKAADVMLHVPYDREVDVRNELAVLTAPYFQEEMAIVVDAAELPAVETFGRFVATPIAVELDTAGDFFLSNAFRGQLQESIRRGRTFEDAARSFVEGEVPALMASRAQVQWVATRAAENGIETAVLQPPMPGIVRTGWPIGIAVRHDSRDLGYAVGDALAELVDSGRMEELFAKYGVEYLPPRLE